MSAFWAFVIKKVIGFAIRLITKPSRTVSRILEVIGGFAAAIILTFSLFTALPTSFVDASGNMDNQSILKSVNKYVNMQDRIQAYSSTRALEKAKDIKEKIINEREADTVSATPTIIPTPVPASSSSSGASATPMPEPVITYELNPCVYTPTWRMLLSLAAIYNNQDFNIQSTESYIEDYVKSRIRYDYEVVTITVGIDITYKITVNAVSDDINELAIGIQCLKKVYSEEEKAALSESYYEFLTYVSEIGTLMSVSYYDVTHGQDMASIYPMRDDDYCVPMPYFNQGETRWNQDIDGRKLILYPPDRTVRTSGCGPTSMAMVIWALLGFDIPSIKQEVNPVTVFDYAVQHGYYKGAGSYEGLFGSIGKKYNITVDYWWPSADRIKAALMKGHPIIAHVGVEGTPYWDSGHYLVIRGITPEGKLYIHDPGNIGYTFSGNKLRLWNMSDLISASRGNYAECYINAN